MSDRYTSVVDSDTYKFVENDHIVEIDAHLETTIPHGAYTPPEVSVEELGEIVDQLRSVGSPQLASRVEIEKRHLESNSAHVFRFNALMLADIVVALSIAKTKANYKSEFSAATAITHFGRLITESTDELLAKAVRYKEVPDLKPMDDDRTFIDPFAVIASTQQLMFVDSHGERLDPQEIVAEEDVDDVI